MVWLAVVPALTLLLAACGEGVSQEELDAAQQELQATQAQAKELEEQLEELQAEGTTALLSEIGRLLSIREIMEYDPTVVELKQNSASLATVTRVKTVCAIAWGLTTDYGQLSADAVMASDGHTDHRHVLTGLQANTVYHYKWGLVGPDGTVYDSKDLTFRTLP